MEKQVDKKICTHILRFHPMLNTHIFMKGFNIRSLKNIYDIYTYK